MGTLYSLNPLGGMLLRYEICMVLRDAERPLSVAEIVRRISDDDVFTLSPAPNKVVADAIRWEVRRGRVVKVRRGTYRVGRVPRSSEFRMRARLHRARAAIRAGMSGRYWNQNDGADDDKEDDAVEQDVDIDRNSLQRGTDNAPGRSGQIDERGAAVAQLARAARTRSARIDNDARNAITRKNNKVTG